MSLNPFQLANFRHHTHTADQVINPETGEPGGGVSEEAIQAMIDDAIDALLDGAPGALDTLNELAAAVNDDASFAASVTTALTNKQPLDSDLTAIAALTTTSFGRSLLAAADASALQTLAGVSTFIKTLLDDADAAAARTTLGITPGATAEVNAAARIYAASNFR